MYRTIISISLLALSLTCKAPNINWWYIPASEDINSYSRLINAIVKVESNGDNLALNVSEQAVGAFQIRPVRIQHYNELTGANYQIEDCFDYDVSRKVFLYFTNGRSYEAIARAWCSGEAGTKKASENYWNKIKAAI